MRFQLFGEWQTFGLDINQLIMTDTALREFDTNSVRKQFDPK